MAIDFDATVLRAGVDAFGAPVTYIPFQYQPFQISGVFDEAFSRQSIIEGMLVSTTTPVLGVRASQFPNPPLQNDHIQINGKIYIVRNVEPDGHGHLKLMLNLDTDYIWP